jgi:hypothetical protein
MSQKYTRILVTKLKPDTHAELKQVASKERRSLSNMSRFIIEDYLSKSKIKNIQEGK